jgi:hypothetical protein
MTSSTKFPAATGLLLVLTVLVFSSVEAVIECKRTQKGEEYSGTKNITKSWRTCQSWASQSPHKHDKWTKFPEGSEEAAKNYCRNPDNSPDGPWCYTTDPNRRWNYCNIKFCEECKLTKRGEDYTGLKSTTVSGRTCKDWAIRHANDSKYVFPDGSFEAAKNYCRNPDLDVGGPWCYTTDPDKLWEYCDIKLCFPVECKKTKTGEEYVGYKNTTVSGRTCQAWASKSSINTTNYVFPEGSPEAAESYCRNPDHDAGGPWCYTTDPEKQWEYCDIKFCVECKKTLFGEDYSGGKTTTVSGRACQSWASQKPHNHIKYTNFPEGSEEEAKNYCRNPDHDAGGPWCWTTDPEKKWEYCDVKYCDSVYCKANKVGEDYTGFKNTTVTGRTCQNWASSLPHDLNSTNYAFPEGNAEAAKNYCRNPDHDKGGPWCKTTDPTKQWEYCDVKICGQCVIRR